MLTAAILLALGATVNAVGIDNRQALEPGEPVRARQPGTIRTVSCSDNDGTRAERLTAAGGSRSG